MYLYATPGTAGAPSFQDPDTGFFGALGAGIAHGVANLAEVGWMKKLGVFPTDLPPRPGEVGWNWNKELNPFAGTLPKPGMNAPPPAPSLTKADYDQQPYAGLVPFKAGKTSGQYDLEYTNLKLTQYYDEASVQHPWVVGTGLIASQALDPLWYIPYADVLRVGKLGTSVFDLGKLGEAAVKQSLNAAAPTLVENLGEKPEDVAERVGTAFLLGGAIGGLMHGLGLSRDQLLRGVQKAAADQAAGRPVDVSEILDSPDLPYEEAKALSDAPFTTPEALQAAAKQAKNPADEFALGLQARVAAGETLSANESGFLEAWKKDRGISFLTKKAEGGPPEGTRPVYNSGTGAQDLWTDDIERARSYGGNLQVVHLPLADFEKTRTTATSEAGVAARAAGNQPTTSDHWLADHPALKTAADYSPQADSDRALATGLLAAAKAPAPDWRPVGTSHAEPPPKAPASENAVPGEIQEAQPAFPKHIQRFVDAEKEVASKYKAIAEGLSQALTCRLSR